MPKRSDTGHAALRSFLEASQGDVVLVIGGVMVPGKPTKDLDDGDLVHFETKDGVSLAIRVDRIDGWGGQDAKPSARKKSKAGQDAKPSALANAEGMERVLGEMRARAAMTPRSRRR